MLIISKVLITDLGSSNGTYLNGKRIPSNTRIAASLGDIIQLGAADSDIRGNSSIYFEEKILTVKGDPIVIQFLALNSKVLTFCFHFNQFTD